MKPLSPLLTPLALLGLAPAVLASDLKLNGTTAAVVPYGEAFQIEVTGGAGLPGFVFVDADPGPITLFGETIPLGLSEAFAQILDFTVPPTGTFSINFPLAQNPQLALSLIHISEPTRPY